MVTAEDETWAGRDREEVLGDVVIYGWRHRDGRQQLAALGRVRVDVDQQDGRGHFSRDHGGGVHGCERRVELKVRNGQNRSPSTVFYRRLQELDRRLLRRIRKPRKIGGAVRVHAQIGRLREREIRPFRRKVSVEFEAHGGTLERISRREV